MQGKSALQDAAEWESKKTCLHVKRSSDCVSCCSCCCACALAVDLQDWTMGVLALVSSRVQQSLLCVYHVGHQPGLAVSKLKRVLGSACASSANLQHLAP